MGYHEWTLNYVQVKNALGINNWDRITKATLHGDRGLLSNEVYGVVDGSYYNHNNDFWFPILSTGTSGFVPSLNSIGDPITTFGATTGYIPLANTILASYLYFAQLQTLVKLPLRYPSIGDQIVNMGLAAGAYGINSTLGLNSAFRNTTLLRIHTYQTQNAPVSLQLNITVRCWEKYNSKTLPIWWSIMYGTRKPW